MSELKLRKLMEHTQRLREQLELPRIKVSEAGLTLIAYVKATKDSLLPSVWGPVDKKDDPFQTQGGGCCSVI
ncbi:G-protein gamma-like domain-containing protein [Globomyces pollinis-pini]|nr:G-protein gamma-like domain-containing protein [Globomyces pollinis-pini]